MREWLYRRLVKWGVVVSPSLALKHWAEGTATKRELEVLGLINREDAR